MNFEPVVDSPVGQYPANGRMLDLGNFVDELDLRINDARLVLKERRQPPHRDVAILVDGGAEDRAAMLAKPSRVVGPAAEQRNAEGGAGDDHTARFIGSALPRTGRQSARRPALALPVCQCR